MKELDINEIVNMNYRVLTLLGIAISLMVDYKNLSENESLDTDSCEWFFNAVQAVIYENKPLPPMP